MMEEIMVRIKNFALLSIFLGVLSLSIIACGQERVDPPSSQTQSSTITSSQTSSSSSNFNLPTSGFTVFDCSFYTNVNLEQFGAVKSNIIYEGTVAALSGQNPDNFKGANRKTSELDLPPKDVYEQMIRQHIANPGPLVLDFETLYLTGSPEDAKRHFDKLSTLLAWTHEVAPSKPVGFFGLLGHTQKAYYSLARTLAKGEDAFFPTLYTYNDDQTKWMNRLKNDVVEARQIDINKPVYTFMTPSRHMPNKDYLTEEEWTFQLTQASKLTNGIVIWSPVIKNTDTGWVNVTKKFLSTTN
jgi:hypothetical protein